MGVVWSIVRKDFRAYYLKPPLITWAFVMPLVLVLAFYLRNPGDIGRIIPGLIGMTVLFGATSMEGIVFTFEKRVGALERLLLAPVSLRQIIFAKVLSGTLFGMGTGIVMLAVGALVFHVPPRNPSALLVALLVGAFTSSAFGMLIAGSVKEVFEAMTLFNFFRFPMVFLCGVFLPVAALALPLRVIAYCLPLTYAIDLLRQALLETHGLLSGSVEVAVLLGFSAALFAGAERALNRRLRLDY